MWCDQGSGWFWLQDQGSKFGTAVNHKAITTTGAGHQSQRVRLRDGDVVTLGAGGPKPVHLRIALSERTVQQSSELLKQLAIHRNNARSQHAVRQQAQVSEYAGTNAPGGLTLYEKHSNLVEPQELGSTLVRPSNEPLVSALRDPSKPKQSKRSRASVRFASELPVWSRSTGGEDLAQPAVDANVSVDQDVAMAGSVCSSRASCSFSSRYPSIDPYIHTAYSNRWYTASSACTT